MANSTSVRALLLLTCCIFNAAGCCCLEHPNTPQSHSDIGQIARGSFDQAASIVMRAASPDGVGHAAPAIELGTPIPTIETDTEQNERDIEADLTHDRVLSEYDLSWDSDKSCFLSEFRGDLESLCSRENALLLLAAGGVSYALHQSLDDDVAEDTARHPNRWGKMQDFFGGVGNPPHELAAISGLYAFSLLRNDLEAHELSKSLFNAVAIAEIGTTALKFAANTTRPNGNSYGWPSGHTSSSFAFASVLDEYYGPWIGLPAYAVAGLVAWERIDDREHDLSDVFFGAALGYVIGRTVAAEHQTRLCGMQLEPFTDPATGSSGIALERRF